jgi:hypothetical protein
VVTAYWVYECSKGNERAVLLVMALAIESLERRFNDAFGVNLTEAEYNRRLSERLQKAESDLTRLGEAYAEPDILREQVTHLEQQIRDMGGEPCWQMPSIEEGE